MRADQCITLAIGGDRLTVICDAPEVLEQLRPLVGRWLTDHGALPGFKIVPPHDGDRLWVLLAADGVVLARAAQPGPIIRTLRRHLTALDSTPHGDGRRLSLGAYVADDGVVLIDRALLKGQPAIERRLAQAGLALLDGPFVELNRRGHLELHSVHALSPIPEADIGHIDPMRAFGRVCGLLWAAWPGAPPSSPGQVAHVLSGAMLDGTHGDRLDAGVAWCDAITVELVDMTVPGSVLRAANSLLDRR